MRRRARFALAALVAMLLAACGPYVEPDPDATTPPPRVPIEVVDGRGGGGHISIYEVKGHMLVCVETFAGTGVAVSCNWLPEERS